MLRFTQKQLKQMAKLEWVKDITKKADADKVNEPLEYIGYSCGYYGISGKMWRGRTSGETYIATNYSASIYRF